MDNRNNTVLRKTAQIRKITRNQVQKLEKQLDQLHKRKDKKVSKWSIYYLELKKVHL